ncbi:MAG: YHS domain-containing protein [Gammaproteobacteria bacterium]|jgi:YHS domain-containing protein|nr:YHS domain-containing protein [Gammaproteobacteria bacterium]
MLRKRLLGVIGLLLLVPLAYAGKSLVFATSDGAIRGHDPVAYFTEGKPTKGSDQYAFEWNGEEFKFTSAENRDLFKANPEKYAPQYGGYCAYAVSRGYTASTVPEAWSIIDDKLYLNYSLDVRKRWQRDIPGNIGKANNNWPGVLN